MGFSINTLSLFGLVLAIGLVVDDAIVVVEAVEHHIEQGMSPERGQPSKPWKKCRGRSIAIALILAAVFIPTAFIPGITGRLYQQFAVTIAVSVVISAFNALTLSPALSALLLTAARQTGARAARLGSSAGSTGYSGGDRWLCDASAARLIRKAGRSMLFLVAHGRRCGLVRLAACRRISPDRGPGLCLSERAAAESPPRFSAPTRSAGKIEAILARHAGRAAHAPRWSGSAC